jgi:hypothetical protein
MIFNQIGYAAVEQFGPGSGLGWNRYVAWSGLNHVTEIVSLSLCPLLIKELTPEDWKHIVEANFMTDYFRDLDYLLRRVAGMPSHVIIGFVRAPDTGFPHGFHDSHFSFVGYDLVDQDCNISALVNCGGFPDCFSNSELNQFGLLRTMERAQDVQISLKQKHPEEPHADCNIWALWVMHSKENSPLV